MARLSMLNDAVTIYNYVGEINDEATYQESIIERCYCPIREGTGQNLQGEVASDSARLYIFDSRSFAISPEGTKRTYRPYNEWITLEDKTPYWTISDRGTDYFKKTGTNRRLKIVGFSHKRTGGYRMWHFEVDGK